MNSTISMNSVKVTNPSRQYEIILLQANFTIFTVDDLYMRIKAALPQAKIAVAMNESEPRVTRVVGNDNDPVACWIAQRNASANNVTLEFDGHDHTCGEFTKADIIIVADMFYTRCDSTSLLDTLVKARTNGAKVYIADGYP